MDRITTTLDYSGFEKLDLVVEAVFEDLDLKQQMVSDIEAACASDVIFATNTSSIPIAQIAAKARRPENIVGMHYFSPVEKMPLLEVVASKDTSAQTVATAVEFGKRQGKTVIVVKDGPGFYVNRILAPYLNEATNLLLAGGKIQDIDAALKSFGFPMGPFELMDEVGLDVGAKVIPVLESALGAGTGSSGVIERMVEQGRLGKKSGKGFYAYGGDGKRTKPFTGINALLEIKSSIPLLPNTIQNRCILLMIQEAVRCLSDGVIRSARDGDVGAVFGIGFPPFLGGPFRYVDLVGAATLVGELRTLASEIGERYQPLASLVDMADTGSSFHENVSTSTRGHEKN